MPLRLQNRFTKKHRQGLIAVSVCHFELSASPKGAPGNEEMERAIIVGVGDSKFKEEIVVYRTNERLTRGDA
jgi:hypothetical protein